MTLIRRDCQNRRNRTSSPTSENQNLYHRGHEGTQRRSSQNQARPPSAPSLRAASAFGGLFHNQNERQAGSEHDCQKKEDVNITHHGGLLLDHAKESGSGLSGGGGCVHAAGHKGRFHLGHHVLCQRIVRSYVCPKGIGVNLSMARRNCSHAGNADTGADVAHEIEQAGGIAHLLFGNQAVGDGGKRHKQQSHGHALQKLRPEDVPVTGVQVEPGELVDAERRNDQAGGQQFARLDFAHEDADDRHKEERPQTAWKHGHTGFQSGVSHERLQPQRKQNGAAVKHEAQHGHEKDTGGVGAIFEDPELHHRMLRDQFANQKEHEPDRTENAQNKDEVRSEPVVFLAFIEHDLERADAQREVTDAPVINAAFTTLDVRRIVNEQHRHDDGRDPDRNVDVEKPAPGVTFGDPAAEHRTKHWSNNDAQRPECHGFGALLRGKGFHQDGLRKWLQASAGCALEHTEDDEQWQVRSDAAEKGKDSEAADRYQQNVATAKIIAQPSRKRQHNGIRDEV